MRFGEELTPGCRGLPAGAARTRGKKRGRQKSRHFVRRSDMTRFRESVVGDGQRFGRLALYTNSTL